MASSGLEKHTNPKPRLRPSSYITLAEVIVPKGANSCLNLSSSMVSSKFLTYKLTPKRILSTLDQNCEHGNTYICQIGNFIKIVCSFLLQKLCKIKAEWELQIDLPHHSVQFRQFGIIIGAILRQGYFKQD